MHLVRESGRLTVGEGVSEDANRRCDMDAPLLARYFEPLKRLIEVRFILLSLFFLFRFTCLFSIVVHPIPSHGIKFDH